MFLVAYPTISTLGVTKGQTLLPNLHWSCLVPSLVYPIMTLYIVSANILFPLGKMIGMVRLRTFIPVHGAIELMIKQV